MAVIGLRDGDTFQVREGYYMVTNLMDGKWLTLHFKDGKFKNNQIMIRRSAIEAVWDDTEYKPQTIGEAMRKEVEG